LISADYSQIELRVVACLAEDPVMMAAFESGKDIHAATAAEIFDVPISKVTADQRRVAKTVNFGVLYGMSAYGLAQALEISRERAQQYIMRYFETHSGIAHYCQAMIDKARKDGYVETLFGFRREFTNINGGFRNGAESEERMAVNAPVQGTAAEVLKLAMIALSEKLKVKSSKSRLILTVHDELIVEASKGEAKEVARLMKDIMESVIKLCVPLEVEVGIGKNWAEAKH
jgi:DNA polymerase-1